MSLKQFSVGDKVMAKWPGSRLYYSATITDDTKKKFFTVKFDDSGGAEMNIGTKFIKSSGSFHQCSESPEPHKRTRLTNHNTPRVVDEIRSNVNQFTARKTQKTSNQSSFNLLEHIQVIFGYLFCIAFPLCLPKLCNTEECLILSSPLSLFNTFSADINDYFNLISLKMVGGYTVYIVMLYLLPIGKIAVGPMMKWGEKLEYRLKGKFVFITIVSTFGFLLYFDIPVNVAYHNFKQATIILIMLSMFCTVVLYLKSMDTSSDQLYGHGNSGWSVPDSFAGREVCPRFGKNFDFKLFSYHYGFGLLLFFNLLYLKIEYETTESIRLELLLSCAMLICYMIAVFYANEEKALHTFDFKYEGCGALFTFGVMLFLPIMYSMQPLYILQHQVVFSIPRLISAVCIYVCGLSLVLTSDMMKFWFRKDPNSKYSRSLAIIEPTKKDGRKLLVAGPWGMLRHPNYLGETLIYFALSLTCGFQHMLYVWFFPVFVFVVLCTRCYRDDKVCLANHGQAWLAYCKRVPYRVIPHIF